jgi:hypothetical protein
MSQWISIDYDPTDRMALKGNSQQQQPHSILKGTQWKRCPVFPMTISEKSP